MTIFIVILAAILLAAAVVTVILRRKGTPIPGTWTIFLALSTILAAIGIWVPLKAPWLVAAIVVWLIAAAIIVFVARFIRVGLTIAVTVAMVLLIIAFGLFSNIGDPRATGTTPIATETSVVPTTVPTATPTPTVTLTATPTPTPTATPAPTATPTPTSVPVTWQMEAADYGENCWFAEGIPEISTAKTDAEAAAAAQIWLEKVKLDPTLLAGASLFLLDKGVDKASLFDKDGWATPAAADLVAKLKLLLEQSSITADMAPSKGYNSGVFDETVKSSSKAGISGDRHAIKIVMPSGKVVWIMGRCGNGVTEKVTLTPTPTPTPTPTSTPVPTATPTPTTTPVPTYTTPPTTSSTPATKSTAGTEYVYPVSKPSVVAGDLADVPTSAGW